MKKKMFVVSLVIVLSACVQELTIYAQSKSKAEPEFLTAPAMSGLPFSEAVRVGETLYLSGQLGTDPKTKQVVSGGITAETKQCLENIKTTLEKYGSSLDRVVKVTVMLADMNEWEQMNKVYVTYFPHHFPARSAFGATALAKGARLEVECIAVTK